MNRAYLGLGASLGKPIYSEPRSGYFIFIIFLFLIINVNINIKSYRSQITVTRPDKLYFLSPESRSNQITVL